MCSCSNCFGETRESKRCWRCYIESCSNGSDSWKGILDLVFSCNFSHSYHKVGNIYCIYCHPIWEVHKWSNMVVYVVKAEKRRDAVNPKIDAARSRRKSRPLFKHRVADNKKNKKINIHSNTQIKTQSSYNRSLKPIKDQTSKIPIKVISH
jgi:hypothetical protein